MQSKPCFSCLTMLCLSVTILAGCPDTKPAVGQARPLSSQPTAKPKQPAVPPVIVPAAPDEPGAVNTDGAQQGDSEGTVQLPDPRLNPLPILPLPAVPDAGASQGDGFPVFPMPEQKVPSMEASAPVLPTPYCFGEAMACSQINHFATDWFNLCGGQTGCDFKASCTAKDTLGCSALTARQGCEAQGCTWFVRAEDTADVPAYGWLDYRRYVRMVDDHIVNPAVEAELHLGRLKTGVAAGDLQRDPERVGQCVPPQHADVVASCAAFGTEQDCNAHGAICGWNAVACQGQSASCDTLGDAASCAAQVGCTWGVE